MHSYSMPKKPPAYSMLLALLALLLMLPLAACETQPLQPSPAAVRSVQLPPLPAFARQPTIPSECLPSCLDGLTRERTFWQTLLIGDTSPAEPASESTTPPAKP